ncbi:hypothetical protein TGAM01_v201523, partial [Trichoderma gamsii]
RLELCCGRRIGHLCFGEFRQPNICELLSSPSKQPNLSETQ